MRLDENFDTLASSFYYDFSAFGLKSQPTHEEIAAKLGVSRWMVTQAIKRAEGSKLVKHIVQPAGERHRALEFLLLDKITAGDVPILHSDALRVVDLRQYPADLLDSKFLLWTVGRMAAKLAMELIESLAFSKPASEDVVIGLSNGSTLRDMANAVAPIDQTARERLSPKGRKCRLYIVPVVGGIVVSSDGEVEDTDAATIVDLFSSGLGSGVRCRLPAPAYLKPPALNELNAFSELNAYGLINPLVERWNAIDVLFTGIGGVKPTPSRQFLLDGRVLGEGDLVTLKNELRAAGDIALNFFTLDGRMLDEDTIRELLDDPNQKEEVKSVLKRLPSVVSVGLRRMHEKSLNKDMRCVAVGTGREKARAFVGALRGRLISGLVTDSDTAQEILECWEEAA